MPVELAGEEPVEGEGGDHRGEERGIETWSHIVKVKCSKSKDFELQKRENVRHACEESEDACDIVAALLGEEGSEDVEKSGKSERDSEDQPFIVVVVHKQGHQGADHDAHTEEVGTPQSLRSIFLSST